MMTDFETLVQRIYTDKQAVDPVVKPEPALEKKIENTMESSDARLATARAQLGDLMRKGITEGPEVEAIFDSIFGKKKK